MRIESCERWLYRFLVFLAASAAYLYGFPSATISYAVVDLLHVAVGVLAFLLLVAFFVPLLRGASNLARLGWLLLAAGTLPGIALLKIGTPLRLWNWLYAHIVLCILGVLLLAASWLNSKGWLGPSNVIRALRFSSLAILALAISAVLWLPRGHLRPVEQFDAPLLVLQQSVVSQEYRIHAGRRRRKALEVVRRLPRSRAALQRVVRHAHQENCESSRSPRGLGLLDVSQHRGSEEHHGPRRLLSRISQVARAGCKRKSRDPDPARLCRALESRASPPHVPQALYALASGGILFLLPQSPPGCAGQPLPLDSRLQ